jgi:hypothetical protein
MRPIISSTCTLRMLTIAKLKEMMQKQLLNWLPHVDIRTDMTHDGCQYNKAH